MITVFLVGGEPINCGSAVAGPNGGLTVAERVMKFDPSDGDALSILNGLYKKGFQTVVQIVLSEWDEELQDEKPLIFVHLKRCDCEQCRLDRGELENYEDEGDGWSPDMN